MLRLSGLFATLNVGKSGLFTQQKAIDVTSHNIANANTEGYSRQRAIMETTRPFGMPSMNNQVGPGQIGTGVEVSTIQRVRDTFMDFQVRNEKSTFGQYATRDRFLSEVESIFNEPSDTGLSTLMGKFFDSWQQLSKQASSSNARTVVANQSAALADELNHEYNQLMEVKENVHGVIKEGIFNLNNLLDQIDQLNQQIIGVKVSGMEPNDLMDRRDLLLDKLSEDFNINIDKKNFDAFDVGPIDVDLSGLPEGAEKLLVRKEPNMAVSRFSYVDGEIKVIEVNGTDEDGNNVTTYNVEFNYLKLGDVNEPSEKITITDIDADELEEVKKLIDQCRVLWADEKGNAYASKNGDITFESMADLEKKLGLFKPSNGQLKGYMSVQKDVDNYIGELNQLAKTVAFAVNAMHSGQINTGNPVDPPNDPIDADYLPFFVNSDIQNDSTKTLVDLLNGESDITAGNISINKEILQDVMKIKTRTNDNEYPYTSENLEDGEDDGNRALAIAQLRDKLILISSIGSNIKSRSDLFDSLKGKNELNGLEFKSNPNGTKIDSFFKDTINKLGIQEQEARRMVKNQEAMLASFQERRDSISGVSLDEEMANLIQFQHAYQANSKIIATVDELLDVVVNGLKR